MNDFLRNFNTPTIVAFVLIPLLAGFGAYVNIWARGNDKYGIVALVFMSLIVTIPWILLVKHSTFSLSVVSVLFDVVYSLSYFVAFYLLGESATGYQWFGVFLSLVGMGFMMF